MRGYLVFTSDDRSVGRVAGVADGYLIVESGRMFKSRRPVPQEFVHVVDVAGKAFVTVPRRVLMDAPQVDRKGRFDVRKAARHFGLAESFGEPAQEFPAWAASEHRRAAIRAHARPGYGREHR
jgi:hypothetical protein